LIIRVFEARLKAGSEQDFMAGERELLRRTDIDGLVAASVGRRLVGGRDTHVITLSIWRDEAALRQFTDDTTRPVYLSGHDEHVETWTIRHFDAVDVPEPLPRLGDEDPPEIGAAAGAGGIVDRGVEHP
jgi:hypothetical protein